jgi:hypothetical protein
MLVDSKTVALSAAPPRRRRQPNPRHPGEEKVNFLRWAEQYVAQLDPLSGIPPNPDQQRDRGCSGEQALKDLLDGSTSAPTCVANDGTTGESNNLNLGACTASGGYPPYIRFTESLKVTKR